MKSTLPLAFVGLTALLPGLARAQATITNYEFSSVAVDYPAAAPNSTTYSLQGSLGQTFVTVDPPTNTGQNLAFLGFWQTGVPYLYFAKVQLAGYVGNANPAVTYGIKTNIPYTAELWNGSTSYNEGTFYADASGNVRVSSYLNPAFATALSIKAPLWLQKKMALNAPADPINGYPNAAYTLPAGDANNDNVVDIGDFGLLVNAYNTDVVNALAFYDTRADLNQDGSVDIGDFGLLVNNYNAQGDP